jgi:hypothetical protein
MSYNLAYNIMIGYDNGTSNKFIFRAQPIEIQFFATFFQRRK